MSVFEVICWEETEDNDISSKVVWSGEDIEKGILTMAFLYGTFLTSRNKNNNSSEEFNPDQMHNVKGVRFTLWKKNPPHHCSRQTPFILSSYGDKSIKIQ